MAQHKTVERPNGSRDWRSKEVQLTPRQAEILRLISDGLTNREISAHLNISARTVEVHRFNLMRRLQVRNVAQLIHQALLMGLLSRSYAKPMRG